MIMIKRGEGAYPPQLETIENPPAVLYCRGDERVLSTLCVAVVGSRKCTAYGEVVARNIGRRMAENGVTIVSGMALGIDSAAMEGAVQAGGKVIAVLGNGVDICYPRQNRKLMDEILKRGAVISEYPPGTEPERFYFPSRNRIISGLSEVVVVVEASYRSGSLITAEHAAAQGRDLLVVPGNITSEASVGSNHLLLDEKVEPLIVIDQIFNHLPIQAEESRRIMESLGPEEEAVYRLLEEQGELTTDQICMKTMYSPQKVKGLITVLEMKGLVVTAMGKVFIEHL